jgi:hypothetical protein
MVVVALWSGHFRIVCVRLPFRFSGGGLSAGMRGRAVSGDSCVVPLVDFFYAVVYCVVSEISLAPCGCKQVVGPSHLSRAFSFRLAAVRFTGKLVLASGTVDVVLRFANYILKPVFVDWALVTCGVMAVVFYLKSKAIYALVLTSVSLVAAVFALMICAAAVAADFW